MCVRGERKYGASRGAREEMTNRNYAANEKMQMQLGPLCRAHGPECGTATQKGAHFRGTHVTHLSPAGGTQDVIETSISEVHLNEKIWGLIML